MLQEQAPGKPKKILVVEDSEVQAQMYRLVYGKGAFELLFAENGKDALQILTKELDISLIITDINMPEMDGLEFMRVVKRISLARCPIILVSTPDNVERLEEGVQSGASAYMVKPWRLEDLKKLTRELLGENVFSY